MYQFPALGRAGQHVDEAAKGGRRHVRTADYRFEERRRPLHEYTELLGVPGGELLDGSAGLVDVFVDAERPAIREDDGFLDFGRRTEFKTVFADQAQFIVLHDRIQVQPERHGSPQVMLESGDGGFLSHHPAADKVTGFDDAGLQPGLGQVGGHHQAVIAGADDDQIILTVSQRPGRPGRRFGRRSFGFGRRRGSLGGLRLGLGRGGRRLGGLAALAPRLPEKRGQVGDDVPFQDQLDQPPAFRRPDVDIRRHALQDIRLHHEVFIPAFQFEDFHHRIADFIE